VIKGVVSRSIRTDNFHRL